MNPVKKMLLLTVGASLVTLFGIGWLLYTAWFVGHAVKTQGQVIAMKHRTPSRGGDFYDATFTFSDASGIIHTQTSYDVSPFKIGDKVTVLYDASNPEHSAIDSSDIWLSPLVLTLFAGFGSFVFAYEFRLHSMKNLT
jgi:Protein of unknown function (DUF3592)